MEPSEKAGQLTGGLLAPVVAFGSAARRTRLFHPTGYLFDALVEPLPQDGALGVLGRRLAGPALVRLSSAWWKDREWPDLLGLAIRFGASPGLEPQPGDQDLLFATVRRPWTLPFAPATTHVRDFLDNDYYAVSPFLSDEAGEIRLRVRPMRIRLRAPDREGRLREAVTSGTARLRLEVRRGNRPYRPVAMVSLLAENALDQDALRFSPFQTGRGVRPVGFIHALRRATYPTGQTTRGLVRRVLH